jgi:deazaflavin-dependent oxidoreductase (nitroreductase family)
MLLLEHVGARSGVRRTTPLVYLRDGDDVVLVASKGGFPRDPHWFHNLRAHPDATVQIGARRRPVHARVADPPQRERLWPRAVALYPGYADYQQRTSREIPLVILTPALAGRNEATRLTERPAPTLDGDAASGPGRQALVHLPRPGGSGAAAADNTIEGRFACPASTVALRGILP